MRIDVILTAINSFSIKLKGDDLGELFGVRMEYESSIFLSTELKDAGKQTSFTLSGISLYAEPEISPPSLIVFAVIISCG